MIYDLVEDLRMGITMPLSDDEAFLWYSEITDKAADKIEQLEQQLAAEQARILELREALFNQLNDCINFNGGQLTTCIMEASTVALTTPDDNTALRKLVAKHCRLTHWNGFNGLIYADKIEDGSKPL